MNFHLNNINITTIQKQIMTSVQTKSVPTSATKKTLKKTAVKDDKEKSAKKVVKEEVKEKAPKKSKKEEVKEEKETKKESKKETKANAEETKEEKPVKEKTPKKINTNKTAGHNTGLNFSVAKVKNVISNSCINEEPFNALKEMKSMRKFKEEGSTEYTFSLDSLSKETLSTLDKCFEVIVESKRQDFSKKSVIQMTEETREKYLEAKKQAIADFQQSQKDTHLFEDDEFNLTEFNLKWDKNFYKQMEKDDWKSLKHDELYTYATNLVNKNKIRFNSESKIYMTAFVEYIVKQLVVNGTIHCVADNKKIIKLEHALDSSADEFKQFTMFPFIASSNTYKMFINSKTLVEDGEETPEADLDESEDDIIGKVQFKHYVGELCRNVRMELSDKDSLVEDSLLSEFNQTSVSKDFKQFCSNIIIELLQTFGNVLKTEVLTRNVKTVNYTIVGTLIRVSHIIHNLESESTIKFIQEKYKLYNAYLKERAKASAAKAADKKTTEKKK